MVHIEFKVEKGQSITKCPYAEIVNRTNTFVGSYACHDCICFIDGDKYSVECRADDLIEDEEEMED